MRGVWIVSLLIGCTGPGPDPEGPKGDGDGSETAEISAAGSWSGPCEGIWLETTTTTTGYEVSIPIVLDLTDADGAVEGTFAIDGSTTGSPLALSGTRQDDALELEVPESDENLGYRFELTLDGDAATGTWSFFSAVEQVQSPLACALER